MTNTMTEFFGEVIHAYTQADAIRDGVIVPIADHLREEAGINWPVLMTQAAHADTIVWTTEDEKRKGFTGQDEVGRTWDVLNMARIALFAYSRRQPEAIPGDRVPFQLYRVKREGRGTLPRRVILHAVVSSADDGSPCFTIQLPHES